MTDEDKRKAMAVLVKATLCNLREMAWWEGPSDAEKQLLWGLLDDLEKEESNGSTT
jgi:hypothetical protein